MKHVHFWQGGPTWSLFSNLPPRKSRDCVAVSHKSRLTWLQPPKHWSTRLRHADDRTKHCAEASVSRA